jgi:two-component SAPR family response regulator
MIRILIVSSENNFASSLFSILKDRNGVETLRSESGNKGLSMVRDWDFHLVIADEKLNDMTGLEFAKKLVSVNPIINQAIASSLSHDEFHEASEGLGILMALPLEPGEVHVNRLLENLQRILQQTIGDRTTAR